jgi:hypothetical protein
MLVQNDGDSEQGSEYDAATETPAKNGDANDNLNLYAQQLNALEESDCNKLFDDLLSTYYTPLEVWYLRSAVDKVFGCTKLHATYFP